MTQIFDKSGVAHPATVLAVGPVTVTQTKNLEKDGYQAIQIGYGERNEKNINKAQKGHFKDLGLFRYLKEFRLSVDRQAQSGADDKYNRGDIIDVSIFEVGDIIEVSAISKGKGFQGVVKRHGFKGGPRTHGNKHHERTPGSIGAQGPQKVLKGKKMAGRMGGERVTVKNLKILQIDKENNQLVLKGAVPGHRGTLVELRVK